MSKRPTPETDAVKRGGLVYGTAQGNKQDWIVDATHMERLERQRAELAEALRELLSVHDEDIGMDEYGDDESVGWEGTGQELPLTFGMLRRARTLLARLDAEKPKPPLFEETWDGVTYPSDKKIDAEKQP